MNKDKRRVASFNNQGLQYQLLFFPFKFGFVIQETVLVGNLIFGHSKLFSAFQTFGA